MPDILEIGLVASISSHQRGGFKASNNRNAGCASAEFASPATLVSRRTILSSLSQMYKYTGTNNNRKKMFHQMGKNKKLGWQPFPKSSG